MCVITLGAALFECSVGEKGSTVKAGPDIHVPIHYISNNCDYIWP